RQASGPLPPESASDLVAGLGGGGLGRPDEGAHLLAILDAGLRFDAGGDVDAVWAGDADPLGDVLGGEAAGQQEGVAGAGGDDVPGGGHPAAAETLGVGIVDEEARLPGQGLLQRGLVVDPDGA